MVATTGIWTADDGEVEVSGGDSYLEEEIGIEGVMKKATLSMSIELGCEYDGELD